MWVPFRERFGITIINEFYNSSELMFGLNNVSRGDFTAKSLGHHGALLRFMTSGSVVPAAVDAETGNLIRDDKTGLVKCARFEEGGEILVKLQPGSKIPGKDFRGYWRNAEATSKKIAYDVLKKGDVYYRTGDALRRDYEGRWFFCDRLGDTFRWKGENVSTTEVAEVLGEYPGVVEANVYGVQLPGHDGRAGAVALLIDGSKKTEFDFAAFLRCVPFCLSPSSIEHYIDHAFPQTLPLPATQVRGPHVHPPYQRRLQHWQPQTEQGAPQERRRRPRQSLEW